MIYENSEAENSIPLKKDLQRSVSFLHDQSPKFDTR